MEGLYQIFDEMQKEGVISNVEVGRVRKNEISDIKRGLDKLKETDQYKYDLAKKLSHFYFIFDGIPRVPKDPVTKVDGKDKYGWVYFREYLHELIISLQRILVGVIEAFANDEELDTFCRYLMNQTVENFKVVEDELAEECNLGKYYICGGGQEPDGLKYITIFPEKGRKEPEKHIPVPFKSDEE